MSDAYGAIIVSVSGDADLQALADALNDFSWSNSNEEFIIESGTLVFGYGVQYPTAYPRVSFPVDADGKPIADADLQEDGDVEFDDREVPLKELSERVSPHLKTGSIEITAVSHEKARYATFETLKIHADGNAERKMLMRSYNGNAGDDIETYAQ
jgi:hypothetical protein